MSGDCIKMLDEHPYFKTCEEENRKKINEKGEKCWFEKAAQITSNLFNIISVKQYSWSGLKRVSTRQTTKMCSTLIIK